MKSMGQIGWLGLASVTLTLPGCNFFSESEPDASEPIEVIEPLADPCPDRVQDMRGSEESFTCSCSTETSEAGTVWGAGPYSDDSHVCRAAMHAGLVGNEPGNVTINFMPGRESYSQSMLNGVETNSWGAWGGSFAFEGVELREPEESEVADACPDDAAALRGTDEPVICRCTADVVGDGTIWGTDVYSDDSAICKAALHAGVISEAGGVVQFVPVAGRDSYTGSEANGVESREYGEWGGSFEFVEIAADDSAAAEQNASAGSDAGK